MPNKIKEGIIDGNRKGVAAFAGGCGPCGRRGGFIETALPDE